MAITVRNRLLAALSPADLELLTPRLERIKLPLKRDLERPNRRIENVYFIESGIVSVVAQAAEGASAEVGLIGYEGMSGIAVLLGVGQTPHSAYMQAAGEGQKISVKQFQAALNTSNSLRDLLLKYVHVFMMQASQTAAANARGTLVRRLARWILMAHDRMRDDNLPLTHEFLSLMLGVRRAGVTETLQILKQRQLIDTGRNLIIVHDRKGLEKEAGGTYGGPEREYRRLIRKF
jgi:CRP-like cAMP-binding protein